MKETLRRHHCCLIPTVSELFMLFGIPADTPAKGREGQKSRNLGGFMIELKE